MADRTALSIAEVVENGLCIGCGLCEAVSGRRVRMVMNSSGSLRPSSTEFTADEEATLLAACPGTVAEPRVRVDSEADVVWGAFSEMRYAWAADDDVRFAAATGGVLTALAMHLLASGAVSAVLHVGPEPARPMRSTWVMSRTVQEVRDNTGSRYGPTAPLAGLYEALDLDQPFAIVAKPCDLGAVHRLSRIDPRVDDRCVLRMAMVCGGQSRLEKSTDVLDDFGVSEHELSLFRYRGFGNPGPTRIETVDGRSFEKTYNEMWDDHAGWKLESRCTICPDALGEAADIAAADVWPGGGPDGEDEGFNGIIVRSAAGAELVTEAVWAGNLVVGDHITPRTFDRLQPHQVRKKEALAARYGAMTELDRPTIQTRGLRVEELGRRLTEEQRDAEISGTLRRIRAGRYSG